VVEIPESRFVSVWLDIGYDIAEHIADSWAKQCQDDNHYDRDQNKDQRVLN
jgi:hypothetical protein